MEQDIRIKILGWICTIFTLLGFYLNARKLTIAFYIWIIGDSGWIWYSYLTHTTPHAGQCLIIILLNIYGIYKWKQDKK